MHRPKLNYSTCCEPEIVLEVAPEVATTTFTQTIPEL